MPEIAARAHADRLAPLIAATLADAGMRLDQVDAIAATAGPGLIGGVMVGLVTAKALAMAADKPLIARKKDRAMATLVFIVSPLCMVPKGISRHRYFFIFY